MFDGHVEQAACAPLDPGHLQLLLQRFGRGPSRPFTG